MTFKHTLRASYAGYVLQAMTNCYPPLLYVTFSEEFNVPITSMTFLIVLNFLVQLTVDLISTRLVDKIRYRTCIVAGHIFSALGFTGFAVLPFVMPPFAALCLATVLSAIGGGVMEVLVSPLVEACPTENKAASMSLLHSFYCWGTVGVVLFATLYFNLFGADNWRILTACFALFPIVNGFFFTKVPMASLVEDGKGMSLRELFSSKLFVLFLALMFCSGASELAMNQWASAFAESGLKVSKTAGDLIGVCLFSVLMGTARVIFSKIGDEKRILSWIIGCCVICIISYLTAALSPIPILALAGCALCGFSVGIMWPGVYSIAAARLPGGGTPMFALLALFGDLGCTLGPATVGAVASKTSGSLSAGLAVAAIFPALMIVFSVVCRKIKTES